MVGMTKKNRSGIRPRRTMRNRSGRPLTIGKKRLNRVIKNQISLLTENKVIKQNAKYFLSSDPNNLNWTDNVRDCCSVLRSITQGTGTANRDGAKIRLKKMMYKYCLYPNINLEQAYPLIVKMWVVSDRFSFQSASTQNIIDACKTAQTGVGNFLEDGNTSTGLQRDLRDVINPVNQERFKVYATRTIKLAPKSAPTSSGTTYAFGNNDFKLFVKGSINLMKYLPKIFKYQDDKTNVQFSRKVFVVYQVVAADGTQLSADNYVNVQDAYDVQFEG